ncbi:MAG: DUF1844 domain-containing protein [Phycisphaerales bacterium]|nr:DUF1844 domain-containing protein [Phycisphaerales bacterium]
MEDTPEPPKIIIDSDWKSQAQAEKERLAEQEKSKPQRSAAPGSPGASAGAGPDDMPPADFRALVGSLATQALLYMGAFPDPETGQSMISLEYARHAIDMLGVLEEKTRGNLNDEEKQDITEVLGELRMRFVQITQLVANAQRQRAAGPVPGTGPGPGSPGMPGGPRSPFTST